MNVAWSTLFIICPWTLMSSSHFICNEGGVLVARRTAVANTGEPVMGSLGSAGECFDCFASNFVKSYLPSNLACVQLHSWLHRGQMWGEVFRGELGLKLHRNVLVLKRNDVPPCHWRVSAMCPWSVGGGLQGEMQVSKSAKSFSFAIIFNAFARRPFGCLLLKLLIWLSKNCHLFQVWRGGDRAVRSHGRSMLLQRKQVPPEDKSAKL